SSESGAVQLLAEQPARDGHAPPVRLRQPPIDHDLPQAERVEVFAESDAAVRVRRLLGRAIQGDGSQGRRRLVPAVDRPARAVGRDAREPPDHGSQIPQHAGAAAGSIDEPRQGVHLAGPGILETHPQIRQLESSPGLVGERDVRNETSGGADPPEDRPLFARLEFQPGGGDLQVDLAARVLQMQLEVSADEPAVVPQGDAGLVLGEQQEPRILDSARRQDEDAGSNREAAVGEDADAESSHLRAPLAGVETQGVGVEVDAEISGPLQLGLVLAAEPRGRGLLEDPADEMRPVERLGYAARREAPLGELVARRAEPEDALRPTIPRVELGDRERPAGVRDALALLEIQRGGQVAPDPAPMVGGAPEIAKTRVRKALVRPPDDAAVIEVLRGPIRLGAPALQQHRAEPGIDELAGQCDARGPPAYDADLGLDLGSVRH
ncbi:hypothetical protein HK102_009112, partial [Quaeritorhiza haematococci]